MQTNSSQGQSCVQKSVFSAVTLWRWRHDEAVGFPTPKVIKGRLYFPVDAISAWLAKQPSEAP
jgi:predicted DNA-binding transcriptional regulator AlpA